MKTIFNSLSEHLPVVFLTALVVCFLVIQSNKQAVFPAIQDIGTYSISDVTWNNMRTLAVKNQMRTIGLPMTQVQALQIDRDLRINLGFQNKSTFPQGSILERGSVVANPSNNAEMIFTASENNAKNAFSFPTKVLTTIFGYDTRTQALRTIHRYASEAVNGPERLDILGTSATLLIVSRTASGSSPGPCHNPWLNQYKHYALNLENPSQPLADWTTPDWKVSLEQDRLQEFCQT